MQSTDARKSACPCNSRDLNPYAVDIIIAILIFRNPPEAFEECAQGALPYFVRQIIWSFAPVVEDGGDCVVILMTEDSGQAHAAYEAAAISFRFYLSKPKVIGG